MPWLDRVCRTSGDGELGGVQKWSSGVPWKELCLNQNFF